MGCPLYLKMQKTRNCKCLAPNNVSDRTQNLGPHLCGIIFVKLKSITLGPLIGMKSSSSPNMVASKLGCTVVLDAIWSISTWRRENVTNKSEIWRVVITDRLLALFTKR